MSVDNGQFEAGRSLGLSYRQTMITIVLPQAFKTVLPALANECIVLLKEPLLQDISQFRTLQRAEI